MKAPSELLLTIPASFMSLTAGGGEATSPNYQTGLESPFRLARRADPLLIVVAIWDGVWKAIGMWKSARNNQIGWFICIAILNTGGILPSIGVVWCQKNNHKL